MQNEQALTDLVSTRNTGAIRASSGSIMGPRRSIYWSIPQPRVLQGFASALVHMVSRESLLFMACTRRKVYLSSWQYVRELQATKEDCFLKALGGHRSPLLSRASGIG